MTARAVNAAVIAGTITSSPGPMSSARSASAMRVGAVADADRVRARRRRRRTRVSNASTSGPRTNQPRATTRVDCRADGGRVFAGTQIDEGKWRRRSRHGDRPRSARHVVVEVRAVELDRASQSHRARVVVGSHPSVRSNERRVGVEVADVDRLLLRRPLDQSIAARYPPRRSAARTSSRSEIGFGAADVEHFAVARDRSRRLAETHRRHRPRRRNRAAARRRRRSGSRDPRSPGG